MEVFIKVEQKRQHKTEKKIFVKSVSKIWKFYEFFTATGSVYLPITFCGTHATFFF